MLKVNFPEDDGNMKQGRAIICSGGPLSDQSTTSVHESAATEVVATNLRVGVAVLIGSAAERSALRKEQNKA